jgi:hypothetical protein
MKRNQWKMAGPVAGLGLMFGATGNAQLLKPVEVKQLTANAKTAADHLKLATHYEAKAAEYEAEAKEHDALAEEYTKHPSGHDQKHPMSGLTAAHCKAFAESSRKSAAEAREIAAAHTAMAKQNSN